MLWFVLGIVASIFWGIATVVDKIMLTKYIKNPFTYHLFLTLSLMPISLVYYLFFPVQFDPIFSLFGFVGGVILGVSFLLYNKALRMEEVSRVAPLMRLSSVFTLIFGFLILGERLAQVEYFGVLMLVIGGLLISWRGGGMGGISKALPLVILLDLGLSMSDVISKYVLGHISYFSLLFYGMVGTLFGRFLLLGSSKIRMDFVDLLKSVDWKLYPITLMSMSSTYVAYLAYYKAISITQVSLVGAIPSLNPLFVLLFAGILSIFIPSLLKEEFTTKSTVLKISAILLVFVGSYLLVL